jgi:hypothetical protein
VTIYHLAQQALFIERYQTRGAMLCALVLLCFALLPQRLRVASSNLVPFRHDHFFRILIGLYAIYGLLYLAYPNYYEDVESTVAYLGLVLKQGIALYPSPDRFPYYGLPYSPGLALSQLPFDSLGLPVLLGSKLPAFIALVISVLALLVLIKGPLARGYLLYLLPFGFDLFSTRAEPLLLLLVSATLLLSSLKGRRTLILVLTGILAGLASSLKLHGAVYVVAAYVAGTVELTFSIGSIALFAASASVAFAACFIPHNISFISFIDYLRLVSHHGISATLWLENLIYLFFLLVPVAIAWHARPQTRATTVNLVVIVLIEFLVTIVGAKPGAGSHHLLPFIPLNAYFIYKLCPGDGVQAGRFVKLMYFSLALSAIATILVTSFMVVKQWQQFDRAGREVIRFGQEYPGLVMGVTDQTGYKYSYLRVLLQTEQIDYPGYMDLQFSGIADQSMAARMNSCSIGYFLLPVSGAPFSMVNDYTGKALFSDAVRTAFDVHYAEQERGSIYSVYRCHEPAADSKPSADGKHST